MERLPTFAMRSFFDENKRSGMSKFKLRLEYDGSGYNGWQIQKGKERTIQGICFDACRQVFDTDDFEFYGAGRTDAGVHALGQVAHLKVQTTLRPEVIKMRLNDALPNSVNILAVDKAKDQFHARHDAVARSYVYQISLRKNAFGKKYAWWIKDQLDVKHMQQAAELFVGMKDFRSFSNEKGSEKSTIVEVKHLQVHAKGDFIVVHIIGSHFLWKMVRRVVGILAEVGRGKLREKQIRTYFEIPSNETAQFTAPAAGLFLERVYYPGEPIQLQFRTLFAL